jgi:RND family efflux transporter MFP subunit
MNATILKARFAIAGCLPFLAMALALPGCDKTEAHGKAEEKRTAVTVSVPVEQEVVDFEEFTGRVDAANKAGVASMVTGYLKDILFTDGHDAEKDQVLFEIDPKLFIAKKNLAEASVAKAKALRDRLHEDVERNRPLAREKNRSLSIEDFKKMEGDLLEAKAAVGMAEAQLEQDTVNLLYTKVTSPFTGRTSRRLIDRGNMVKANETMLTWIYQIDPMYGYFDVDERTVIKIRKLTNEGKIKSYREGKIEVDVGLADEEGYSLKGYIDWVDNVLDAGTGTLKIRSVIAQPRDASGKAMVLVSPGMFVRVKLPTSTPRQVLLIAEKAIATDQGEKYLLVVNEKNEIERRNVILGQLQAVTIGQVRYNLRVVEKNPAEKGKDLVITDRVVVSGLQRVRPGDKVEPTVVAIPGGVPAPRPIADLKQAFINGKGAR